MSYTCHEQVWSPWACVPEESILCSPHRATATHTVLDLWPLWGCRSVSLEEFNRACWEGNPILVTVPFLNHLGRVQRTLNIVGVWGSTWWDGHGTCSPPPIASFRVAIRVLSLEQGLPCYVPSSQDPLTLPKSELPSALSLRHQWMLLQAGIYRTFRKRMASFLERDVRLLEWLYWRSWSRPNATMDPPAPRAQTHVLRQALEGLPVMLCEAPSYQKLRLVSGHPPIKTERISSLAGVPH